MVEMITTLLNGNWELTLPKHRAERPAWHSDKGLGTGTARRDV